MIPVSVRRSHPDEAEQALAIWSRSVDATHTFLLPADRAKIESELRDFLPDAPLRLAVTPQDKPIAFMLLSEHHLEALFSIPMRVGVV
ncbi:hypothetical protein EJP617_29040 [Erwinia sp. Ejp617]|nr:hypothetical protein EJP617_29040 [Erwinia sp. Ejp617]